jgi:hypothetical protein
MHVCSSVLDCCLVSSLGIFLLLAGTTSSRFELRSLHNNEYLTTVIFDTEYICANFLVIVPAFHFPHTFSHDVDTKSQTFESHLTLVPDSCHSKPASKAMTSLLRLLLHVNFLFGIPLMFY